MSNIMIKVHYYQVWLLKLAIKKIDIKVHYYQVWLLRLAINKDSY